MLQSFWLIAAQTVNDTPTEVRNWPAVPIIITLSCLFVLFIASRSIQRPHDGPKAPLGPLAPLFNNISLAGFIGALSLGHILGVLLVFGLAPYVS